MRTHYGPWQPCWITNQHQKHKSGRGPSSEDFWQVWLISVQWFQRRRFKCEKLTDGRLPMTKAHMAYARWAKKIINKYRLMPFYIYADSTLSVVAWIVVVDWSVFTEVPTVIITVNGARIMWEATHMHTINYTQDTWRKV